MEWSVQHIAKLAGTTSRTLRHYDHIGLVPPARVGAGGYRYYDQESLVRLQRVMLLRDLGLSLEQIRQVLDSQTDAQAALITHLDLLRHEQDRLTRQVAAVETTLSRLKGGEPLMPDTMFDGFDHTQYREEVEQRWGAEAYRSADQWWSSMSDADRDAWQHQVTQLNADWAAAASDPAVEPTAPRAQDLAARHVQWLRSVPGTPAADSADALAGYVRSLAQMYVADERFAANYGGVQGAAFVRDALLAYLDAR